MNNSDKQPDINVQYKYQFVCNRNVDRLAGASTPTGTFSCWKNQSPVNVISDVTVMKYSSREGQLCRDSVTC